MRQDDTKAFVSGLRILTLLLAALFLAACAQEATPPPETAAQDTRRPWAILYAFSQEGRELLEWSTIRGSTVWAGRPVAQGWLVQPVVIAATGVGMTNAAAATQHIIDTYNPVGIIFTGICGAIDPEVKVGDVSIADRWITHDFGFWGAQGFLTDSLMVGRPDTTGYDYILDIPVDTNLARRLGDAADAVAFRFRRAGGLLPDVHRGGVGVSGNAFIGSASKRDQLHEKLGAVIVDMESAAVVQTARAAGVPVVVVRASSDLAGGGTQTAEEELRENFKTAAHNAALVVKQFLETGESQ